MAEGKEAVRQFVLHWFPTGRDNDPVEVPKLQATLRAVLEEVKKLQANLAPTNLVSFKESAMQVSTISKKFDLDKSKCYKDLGNNPEYRAMIEDFVAKASVIVGAPNLMAKKAVPDKPRPASIVQLSGAGSGSTSSLNSPASPVSRGGGLSAAPFTPPIPTQPVSPFQTNRVQPHQTPSPSTSSPVSSPSLTTRTLSNDLDLGKQAPLILQFLFSLFLFSLKC